MPPFRPLWRPAPPRQLWRRRVYPFSPAPAEPEEPAPPPEVVGPADVVVGSAVPPAGDVFRFLVEDITSGQVIVSDLRLQAWSYEDVLNRAGVINGVLPVTSPDATEQILDPWRVAVYVERNGKIEMGGPLRPPILEVGATVLQVSCFDWVGYLDLRTIRTDYQPTDVEQFDIFRQLVLDAQDEGTFGAGWDLGIDVIWDAPSGVARSRSEDYLVFQGKNLGEALRQLAAVGDGFDFAMTYTLNTTTNRIEKAIKLFYPRKGRDTGYLFEYERGKPKNVLARGFADPVQFAWAGDGWGEGADESRLRSAYVDETLRGIYPPYDAAPTWQVSTQSTLDEHTAAFFARRDRPKRIPKLRIDPKLYPRWGDYEIGDTVLVRIDDGYGSIPIPARYRITGTRVAADLTYEIVLGDPLGEEDDA